jgi:hypothetical protein
MNTEDLHRNCIAFGEWLCMNYEPVLKETWAWENDTARYSTSELFTIYLKELNEKNI